MTHSLPSSYSAGVFSDLKTSRACHDICPLMLCRVIKKYNGILLLKLLFQEYFSLPGVPSPNIPYYTRSDLFSLAVNHFREKPSEDSLEELVRYINQKSGMILIIPSSHPEHRGVRPTNRYCLNPVILRDFVILREKSLRFPLTCPFGNDEKVFLILNYLAEQGSASIQAVQLHFGFCRDTAYRTINQMHFQQLVRKTHQNGAKSKLISLNSDHFLINDLSFSVTKNPLIQEKLA